MKICVFGASSSRLDPVFFQEAEQMGRLIGQLGHCVVFGGGADGLMGACARGAKSVGGRVIGIAPHLFNEPGFLLPECDELILTDSMSSRKEKMFDLSDAILSLPGGIGTMDEFFETLVLAKLGKFHGRIAVLNLDGFYEPLRALLNHFVETGMLEPKDAALVSFADTPEELAKLF